jgi:hypothetical protein
MRSGIRKSFIRSVILGFGIGLLPTFRSARAGAVVPILFTGTTTFNTPTVTTTTETPDVTIVAPGFIFPEFTPATATDLSDGFNISGRLDFLNGSGTAAEVMFTASRPVNVFGPTFFTSSTADGDFGILSGDIGNGGTSAVSAHLDSFSETTILQTVAASSVTASDMNETIPLTVGFPNDAYHSLSSAVAVPFAASGNFVLLQTVDIRISGLLPGETVDIGLPTTSTIDLTPVPEPCAGSLVIGVVAFFGTRRKRV